MVIWSSTDENGDQNEFYCLESSDPGKTDEEKVKDTEEYLKSDEYKLDSERHSIMDEYAKKNRVNIKLLIHKVMNILLLSKKTVM